EVALSLVLMAGALLFSRSLNKLLTVVLGFRQEGVLIADVGFRRLNVPTERRLAFKLELLDRIRGVPGVESVTDTNLVPLSGSASGNNVWLDGADSQQRSNTFRSRVGPDYFKTLGTRLLAGREFDERDTTNAPNTAIVNEAFARMLLNGANPVGRSFWIEKTPFDPQTPYDIVAWLNDPKSDDFP